MQSTVIGTFCCAQTFATLISFLLGAILPDDDDTQALIDTDRWLVLYIYVPIGMQVAFLISMIVLFKYEPIKFLIQEDRMDEAVAAVC